MAKYHGNIGFAETQEVRPGVWEEIVVERPYYGDILRNTRKLSAQDKVNSDISVSNTFSIVADAYATLNFFAIRYICWMGSRWTVDTVEVNRPRLSLTVSGVYNGPVPEET